MPPARKAGKATAAKSAKKVATPKTAPAGKKKAAPKATKAKAAAKGKVGWPGRLSAPNDLRLASACPSMAAGLPVGLILRALAADFFPGRLP